VIEKVAENIFLDQSSTDRRSVKPFSEKSKLIHVLGERSSTLTSGSFLRLLAASKNTSTVSLSKFVNRTRSTEQVGSSRKNCSAAEKRILAQLLFGNPNIPLLIAGAARLTSCRLWHSTRELYMASRRHLSSPFWPPSHTGPIKHKNNNNKSK